MYPCTKLYHQETYYYQVIDKNINKKFSCLRLFGVVYKLVIHVIIYMMALNVGPKFNRHRCYSYRATCKKNFVL